jgi:dCMP deaminase
MRPSRDVWAMKLALLTAQRTTCCRRAVGCVLLNARGHVLATGYNGVAAGLPHCNEHDQYHPIGFPNACSGAHAPSGTNLDGCQAIHAEQNALLQCKDIYAIHTCYVTASPCVTCCKLLLNTGCERIVYKDEYPHSAAGDLWTGAGRTWERLLVEI